MLCRGLSGLTRSVAASAPKVGAMPLNGSAFVPLRASTTSHKHNNNHSKAAEKHRKSLLRAVSREGTTKFDLYDKISLDDFHRYVSAPSELSLALHTCRHFLFPPSAPETHFSLFSRSRSWPRPLVLESDTIPGFVRPAAQLVTKKPYGSLDVIPF